MAALMVRTRGRRTGHAVAALPWEIGFGELMTAEVDLDYQSVRMRRLVENASVVCL